MRRGTQSARARVVGAATFALLVIALSSSPSPALAAKLIGGRQQSAIRKAFSSGGAHKGQVIVSIRSSTVSGAWSVVKSLKPQAGGGTSSRPVRLLSSYYDRVGGGRERGGRPPAKVKADLLGDFRLAIVYAGSGAEAIHYRQVYRSVCAGAGGFTDQQDSIVSPMSWKLRYVVDLDDVLSAVRTDQGTTIVPSISFDGGGSTLKATQTLTRSVVDAGCDGKPATFKCTTAYGLGGRDPGSMLSFPPGLGTEVGIPFSARSTGQCDPDDYTLGASLWDNGAATALVSPLNPVGGSLPANPYSPVSVSWPRGSAQGTQGFITSPCQGISAACTDKFRWSAKVTLQAR
jgi:hypothetical protein